MSSSVNAILQHEEGRLQCNVIYKNSAKVTDVSEFQIRSWIGT